MSRWPLTIEQRLSVRIVKADNKCLEYTGAKAGNGYGTIWYKGRQTYTHRVVWELHNDLIPDGSCVLHTCDNPACCNIDHLFLGSHKDNTQDMMRKGRWVKPSYRIRELVDPILDLHEEGLSNPEVARRLNISTTSVYHVVNGNRWKSDMVLYNLRSALDDFRITKFTPDLDVESSYLIGPDEHGTMNCECPAGVRSTCRHRQMLPTLMPLLDTEFFWDFERRFACDANGIPMTDPAGVDSTEPATLIEEEEEEDGDLPTEPTLSGLQEEQILMGFHNEPATFPPLPKGVTMVSLDEPAALHNAIADAVGEPQSTSWRRI